MILDMTSKTAFQPILLLQVLAARNSLVSFCGQMLGSHIEDFFLPCVVDTLIGEKQHTCNDEQDPQPTGAFHFLRRLFGNGPVRKTAVAKTIKTKVDVDCQLLNRGFVRVTREGLRAA